MKNVEGFPQTVEIGKLVSSVEPPQLLRLRRVLVRVYPVFSHTELAEITGACMRDLEATPTHPLRRFPFGGAPLANLAEMLHGAAVGVLKNRPCFVMLSDEERALLKLCFLYDLEIKRISACLGKPYGLVAQRLWLVTRKIQNAYLFENKERFMAV
jgi:hypothetical protein